MYGAIPQKKLPPQDSQLVLLLIDRWYRASQAHAKWAEPAKQAVDFLEGRQWTQEAMDMLAGRPVLTINKINRLVRLLVGFFSNNRIDLKFLAGHDGSGTEAVAETLTHLAKQASEITHLPYVDVEVFMDGITTGRGFYDDRMCFDRNDFGELKSTAADPFATYLDPDGQSYDLNETCGYTITSKMACLDEIEYLYGKAVRDEVEPFALGRTPIAQYTPYGPSEEISPIRRFGNSEDIGSEWWDNLYNQLGAFHDPLRKSLRIMDFQHWVRKPAKVFVDLETGDRSEIPDYWGQDKIAKVMWWAEQNRVPLYVDKRVIRKIRWTTLIGDVIAYNDWSQYKTFTQTPYFPYFRRGVTRGMVEDLIDPQREKNKRRSTRIDTLMRVAHSGWKYHETSLDPDQEQKLLTHGGEPGFAMKWKGNLEPKKIEPSATPGGLRDAEKDAEDDMKEVSGINDSALGELDIGQSGRAIEARQRQTVVGVQLYLTNYSRTKELQGCKYLEIFQCHYTEQRTLRILGEDGKQRQMMINQRVIDPASNAERILNDLTIGRYEIAVDETPLAATFASAQFEEMLALLQKLGPIGQALAGIRPDLIIDLSSLPRKEEWKQALMQAVSGMNQVPTGPQPPGIGPPSMPPNGGQAAPPPAVAAPAALPAQPNANVLPMRVAGAQAG